MQPVFSFAQYTSKDQAEKNKTTQMGSLSSEILVNQTSRNDDIKMFTNAMTMLNAALNSGAMEEANVWRNKIVQIAAVEIARSKRNLAELQAGKTEHLEKWWEENKPNSRLIVNVEINTLENRINHEQYLYNQFESWDLNKMKTGRSQSTLRGNLNSFKRDMESNLRFGSDKKNETPQPPPGNEVSTVKGNAQGGTAVVNKSSSENPAVANYFQSQKMRKEEFQKNKTLFQQSLNDGDDKAAKKAYKALLTIMQDEVNANSWVVNMIDSGNIKDAGIDVTKLSATLKNQRPLANKAAELKQPASANFSSVKNQISGLVNNFWLTM